MALKGFMNLIFQIKNEYFPHEIGANLENVCKELIVILAIKPLSIKMECLGNCVYFNKQCQ